MKLVNREIDEKRFEKIYGKKPTFTELKQAQVVGSVIFSLSKAERKRLAGKFQASDPFDRPI